MLMKAQSCVVTDGFRYQGSFLVTIQPELKDRSSASEDVINQSRPSPLLKESQ